MPDLQGWHSEAATRRLLPAPTVYREPGGVPTRRTCGRQAAPGPRLAGSARQGRA